MPDSIVCPRCGLRSYHPKDVEERFCGRCHEWHATMTELPAFVLVAEHAAGLLIVKWGQL